MPSRVTGDLEQYLIRKDKAIRAAIRTVLMDTGQELKEEAEKVVRTWKKRPAFAAQPTIRPDFISVEIKVGGAGKKVFGYIDQGTKGPYLIKPKKKGGMLKFQRDYSPKTLPINKFNVGTGRKSGPWMSKKSVMHPGIKPRKFLLTQGDELEPPLDARIAQGIMKAILGG